MGPCQTDLGSKHVVHQVANEISIIESHVPLLAKVYNFDRQACRVVVYFQ